MKIRSLVVLLGIAFCTPVARAAPAPAPETTTKKKPPAGKPPGLVPSLFVGLNFAFSQSQGVVGVPDGIAMALGLTLRGGLHLARGPHRWRTTLLIQEGTSKVPGIEPFIKGIDVIEVTSGYAYHLPRIPRLSLGAGIRLRGTLLEGNLVRAQETRLQLTSADGAVFTDVVGAQTPYPLTAFLAPLILEQTAGVGLAALRQPAATLSVGVGLVAHQVLAQGGYTVHDDEATADVLELVQLRDYVQGGVEARVALHGRVADKLLRYQLGARVMLPFATHVMTGPDPGFGYDRLVNVELRAALSIRIFSWASLEYSLSVLRLELLSPGWQVANHLMLSVTASVGGPAGEVRP